MTPFLFFPDNLKPMLMERGLLVPDPQLGEPLSDLQAMRVALQEATKGLGFTSPNPLVGCVILDSHNRFLSKGYHARVGEAHAEVNALKGLTNDQLKSARIFVTLEPCAHEGRTPSCARTIAKLPVKEVVYGLQDPNPMVSGQGAKILRDAGIRATLFSEVSPYLQRELEEVCEHFLCNMTRQKIFVSLKAGVSLDGQLALKNGESQWITSESSREIAHVLRAAHDAILVGSGTVGMDNPSLNNRSKYLSNKQNKIVILDSDALLLAKADQLKLAGLHSPQDVYFAISDVIANPPNPWGAQVIPIPAQGLGLNLQILLTKLWTLGIRSLIVEGGAQVLSSFINEKIADRLYLFQAPMILGANSGKPWSEQVNIGSMKEKISLRNHQFIPLDTDLLTTGKFS